MLAIPARRKSLFPATVPSLRRAHGFGPTEGSAAFGVSPARESRRETAFPSDG